MMLRFVDLKNAGDIMVGARPGAILQFNPILFREAVAANDLRSAFASFARRRFSGPTTLLLGLAALIGAAGCGQKQLEMARAEAALVGPNGLRPMGSTGKGTVSVPNDYGWKSIASAWGTLFSAWAHCARHSLTYVTGYVFGRGEHNAAGTWNVPRT
jgi:hypothetical protein